MSSPVADSPWAERLRISASPRCPLLPVTRNDMAASVNLVSAQGQVAEGPLIPPHSHGGARVVRGAERPQNHSPSRVNACRWASTNFRAVRLVQLAEKPSVQVPGELTVPRFVRVGLAFDRAGAGFSSVACDNSA